MLLGGDLFHKNKPSRRSMFKCINLLRKYSLGNKPCEFEFLGDPDQVSAEMFAFNKQQLYYICRSLCFVKLYNLILFFFVSAYARKIWGLSNYSPLP